jgi:hypothetical protein
MLIVLGPEIPEFSKIKHYLYLPKGNFSWSENEKMNKLTF